jgi:hypothetical protein
MEFFIEDGYTAPGYLQGEPKMFPALRFTYRPMTPAERAAWWAFEERQDKNPDAQAGADAKSKEKVRLLSTHVLTWEATGKNGQAVPVDATWLPRLHATLHDRLFNVVLGIAPPDDDPDKPGQAKPDEAKDAKN